jgi:hypothetical protein
MGGFSFRSRGGGGGGAELCFPHLGGVGEDATGGIIAAGIHLAGGGGWGSEARTGEGEGVQINWSIVCGGLLAYVHPRRHVGFLLGFGSSEFEYSIGSSEFGR